MSRVLREAVQTEKRGVAYPPGWTFLRRGWQLNDVIEFGEADRERYSVSTLYL